MDNLRKPPSTKISKYTRSEYKWTRTFSIYKTLRKKAKGNNFTRMKEFTDLLSECMTSLNVPLATIFHVVGHLQDPKIWGKQPSLYGETIAHTQSKHILIETGNVLSHLALSCRSKEAARQCIAQIMIHRLLNSYSSRLHFFSEASEADHPLSQVVSISQDVLPALIKECRAAIMKSERNLMAIAPFFKFALRNLTIEQHLIETIYEAVSKHDSPEIYFYFILWEKNLKPTNFETLVLRSKTYLPPDLLCLLSAAAIYKLSRSGCNIMELLHVLKSFISSCSSYVKNIVLISLAFTLLSCCIFSLQGLVSIVSGLIELPGISLAAIMALSGACVLLLDHRQIVPKIIFPLLSVLSNKINELGNIIFIEISQDTELLCYRYEVLSKSALVLRFITSCVNEVHTAVIWLSSLRQPLISKIDPSPVLIQSFLTCGKPKLKLVALNSCQSSSASISTLGFILKGAEDLEVLLKMFDVIFELNMAKCSQALKTLSFLEQIQADESLVLRVYFNFWRKSPDFWVQYLHHFLCKNRKNSSKSFDLLRTRIIKEIYIRQPDFQDNSFPFRLLLFRLLRAHFKSNEVIKEVMDCLHIIYSSPTKHLDSYIFFYSVNLFAVRSFEVREKCCKLLGLWGIKGHSFKRVKQSFDLLWLSATSERKTSLKICFTHLSNFWLSCFTRSNLPPTCRAHSQSDSSEPFPDDCWIHLIQSCPDPQSASFLFGALLKKEPRYGRKKPRTSTISKKVYESIARFLGNESFRLQSSNNWIEAFLRIIDLGYNGPLQTLDLSFLSTFLRFHHSGVRSHALKILLLNCNYNPSCQGILVDLGQCSPLKGSGHFYLSAIFPFVAKETSGVIKKLKDKQHQVSYDHLDLENSNNLVFMYHKILDNYLMKDPNCVGIKRSEVQASYFLLKRWLESGLEDVIEKMGYFDDYFKNSHPALQPFLAPFRKANSSPEAVMKFEKALYFSCFRAYKTADLNHFTSLVTTAIKFKSLQEPFLLGLRNSCKFIYESKGRTDLQAMVTFLLEPLSTKIQLDFEFCFFAIMVVLDAFGGCSNLGPIKDTHLRVPMAIKKLNRSNPSDEWMKELKLRLLMCCQQFDQELRTKKFSTSKNIRNSMWASYLNSF